MRISKQHRSVLLDWMLRDVDDRTGARHVREYRFHRVRLWRFDVAWPDLMVAVEIEGGVWSGGRHVRGKGYLDDMAKYNAATEAGWRIFRYSWERVESGEMSAEMTRILASARLRSKNGVMASA